MADKDELYQDILEGLALYLDSPFVADVLEAVARHPVADFGNALNRNQMLSKIWLIDELHRALGGRLGAVYVLGGWYGVLAAMLLADSRFEVGQVLSVDLDPACAEVAARLNRRHAAAGRFRAVTADMGAIRFAPGETRLGAEAAPAADLVVNTSCEHLGDFAGWYGGLAPGTRLVLQSNDFYAEEGHLNCVADLDAFKAQAPLSALLYEGALKLKKYTRFMLIGRR